MSPSPNRELYRCPKCGLADAPGKKCPEHGLFLAEPRSLERDPQPPLLGIYLRNKYAMLGVLGTGATSEVYWALEFPSGNLVAVKVLRAGLTRKESTQKRFMREAALIHSIENPRLIKCYEYGIEDGVAFMVLEVLVGMPLHAFMASRHVHIDEISTIASQMLEGVAAIHSAGLMHRDLKPGNVMICDVGNNQACVKIIDFGLAKALSASTGQDLTAVGEILGTAKYMSPDSARGTANVGPATDVYSLGVILYEMLAGEPPFDAAHPAELVRQHMMSPVPPLVDKASTDCPPGLMTFVHRCLAKTVERRFKTGSEALAAFWQLELNDEGPLNFQPTEVDPSFEQRDPTIALSDEDLIFEAVPTHLVQD